MNEAFTFIREIETAVCRNEGGSYAVFFLYIFMLFPNCSNGILDRSGKVENFWLLLTSFIFVMSASVYAITILLLIVVFSFIFGLLLEKSVEKDKKNTLLLWSRIIFCLLPLILLKYHNFLPDIGGNSIWKEKTNSLTAPVGISF